MVQGKSPMQKICANGQCQIIHVERECNSHFYEMVRKTCGNYLDNSYESKYGSYHRVRSQSGLQIVKHVFPVMVGPGSRDSSRMIALRVQFPFCFRVHEQLILLIVLYLVGGVLDDGRHDPLRPWRCAWTLNSRFISCL